MGSSQQVIYKPDNNALRRKKSVARKKILISGDNYLVS